MMSKTEALAGTLEDFQDALTDISIVIEQRRDALTDVLDSLEDTIRKMDDAIRLMRVEKTLTKPDQ